MSAAGMLPADVARPFPAGGPMPGAEIDIGAGSPVLTVVYAKSRDARADWAILGLSHPVTVFDDVDRVRRYVAASCRITRAPRIRVVLDRPGDQEEYRRFRAVLAREFQGEILCIFDDGHAVLESAMTDFSLTLSRDELDEYLRDAFGLSAA